MATTLNDVLVPVQAVVDEGCVIITTGSFTVSVAWELTAAAPQSPVTSQEYKPASPATRFDIESTAVLLPVIFPGTSTIFRAPFFHWYTGLRLSATTVNTTLLPVHLIALTGFVSILLFGFTFSKTLLLVTVPVHTELDTTQ